MRERERERADGSWVALRSSSRHGLCGEPGKCGVHLYFRIFEAAWKRLRRVLAKPPRARALAKWPLAVLVTEYTRLLYIHAVVLVGNPRAPIPHNCPLPGSVAHQVDDPDIT